MNLDDVAIEKRRGGYTIDGLKGRVTYHNVIKEQGLVAFWAQRNRQRVHCVH